MRTRAGAGVVSADTAPAARALELKVRSLAAACLIGVAISWNIANVGPVATLLAHTYGTTLAVSACSLRCCSSPSWP
jgi:hypothetical protein